MRIVFMFLQQQQELELAPPHPKKPCMLKVMFMVVADMVPFESRQIVE